jgi:flagellar hook-length control protein FliK
VTVAAPAAPTGPAERSVPGSEITDQVAAQIGRQLQGVRTLRDGTHHTVLRLSPEHLGDVTITLDVRAGGLRLDLAAGSQVLVALQADLGRLRDDLAGSGLALGDVTLSAQDAGPGTNGQPTSRERWQDPAPSGRGGDGPRPSPTEQFARRAAGRTTDGGLDVLA